MQSLFVLTYIFPFPLIHQYHPKIVHFLLRAQKPSISTKYHIIHLLDHFLRKRFPILIYTPNVDPLLIKLIWVVLLKKKN